MKIFFSLLLSFFAFQSFAASPFKNLDKIQKSLGFKKYYPLHNGGRRLRVAILDKGFYGYQEEIGKTLPSDTTYNAGPVAAPDDLKSEHGLKMAQILTALVTNEMKTQQWQPQLYLYNVFGFTNFNAAIDDLIAHKIDVVLYSEVWEYGGNQNGKGFINAQVSRATKAGVVWVNAAGNFAKTTYNTPVNTLENNWVRLPDQNDALSIQCKHPEADKCQVKIVLSWNDFKDDVNLGTSKDLDLVLTDDLLNIIEVGGLKQSSDSNESRPQYSKYPREIVTAELKTGSYFIRVKNQSHNFSSDDQLRITVDGEGITMSSRTEDETLLNPADNPSVITVGASDSDRSGSSVALKKPDVLAPSSLTLENDEEFRGSSNSAAIVAAGITLLKSKDPQLTRKELLGKIRSRASSVPANSPGGSGWNQSGLSLQYLGFAPLGNASCFTPIYSSALPYYVQAALNQGGVLVQTTASNRIMVPFDPLLLLPRRNRVQITDMVVATPRGYELYPRNGFVAPDGIEVFQRPAEAGLCQDSSENSSEVSANTANKAFYLP